jgi:hypothetical protein
MNSSFYKIYTLSEPVLKKFKLHPQGFVKDFCKELNKYLTVRSAADNSCQANRRAFYKKRSFLQCKYLTTIADIFPKNN